MKGFYRVGEGEEVGNKNKKSVMKDIRYLNH